MRKYLLLCLAFLSLEAVAKISLPQLFQSGMVLQRDKAIPVWGKADAGEMVTIRFNKKQYVTTAGLNGKWRIDLPKMKAGGPYTMTVGDIVLTNILIGDVWLLSGQSNIDVTIERVYPQYTQEIDTYENPNVRLFRVQNETDTHGVRDDIKPTPINWKPLNKQNAWLFSAVGYFLGKRMQEQTKVPQGIIVNSWGGTPIEAWISADSLQQDYPLLVKKTQLYQNDSYVKAQAQANMEADRQWQKLLNEQDPGIEQNWTAPDFDDTDWQTVNQYATDWALSPKSKRPVIGTIWLRQHIQVDKAHAGKPARLLLGTLFDQDITYLNGKEIGHTYYQYPPRRYDDRMSLNPLPTDVIPLSENWQMHLGTEMPSCPSSDISLQNLPTTLYNAVLHPLAPYALSGVVWYQGESNTGHPAPYADYLKKMVGCWRDLWHDQQMPFVIVQLANYDGRQQSGFPRPITPQTEPMNSGWAQLREAQRIVAKADPRTELAVINDLGETVDIHPLRKKEVAERICIGFDRLVYHHKVTLSPEVIAAVVKKGQVTLTLDQPIQEGNLYEFEVAGEDGIFHNVTAQGAKNIVLLDCASLSAPTAVRYAWKDNPLKANVRSLSGLPMSSFELKVKK